MDATGLSLAAGLEIGGLERCGEWNLSCPSTHQFCFLLVYPSFLSMPIVPRPLPSFPQLGLPHTLALGHTGGAIKVSAGVSWTAGAEVLTEVRLIGPHGTADTTMDAGVVVVSWGALDCRQREEAGVKMTGRWVFWGVGWSGPIGHGESGDKTPKFSQGLNLSKSYQNLSPEGKIILQSG